MCDLDVMGAPSKLSVIRKAVALRRVRPTFLLSWAEKAAWWSLVCITSVVYFQQNKKKAKAEGEDCHAITM